MISNYILCFIFIGIQFTKYDKPFLASCYIFRLKISVQT